VLDDPTVSRRHAEIASASNGTVALTPIGGNRTVVNGMLAPVGTPLALSPNASIQLGACTLTYIAPMRVAPMSSCGDASGIVLNVRYSQENMPSSAGLWLARASIVVFVVMALIVIATIAVTAIVCSCGVIPVLLAVGYAGYRLLKDAVLGRRQMTQIAFSVQNPLDHTLTPVVVFTDTGGQAALNDGDDVVVYGRRQSNNTLLAKRVEIHASNGVPIQPPSRISGKQPLSLLVGLVWLLISLSPLIFLALAVSGFRLG
jgi:hypothetical protein